MASILGTLARSGLTAALAVSLSLPAAMPAHAEKGGGKPERAGGGKPDKGPGRGGPQKGVHEKGGHAPHGGPSKGGGVDAGAILATGATAVLLGTLLGGQTQVLAVGAKPLPPGIAKNLGRGKPLPPGIAKQAVPGPVLARLPVVDGHEWVRVGTELVLVAIATAVVAQVIHDAFS